MLDGVSFDQLRAFIAAVDEGSFSAAGRKLSRAQSAISDMVSGLEVQIGITLFDRSGRYPKLTPAGVVILADARGIIANIEFMKARAKGMSEGVEPELSVVLDVFYPIEAITEAAKQFRATFPATPLRLYVEALGAVYQPVLDGIASIGVVGPLPVKPSSLTAEALPSIAFTMVAARSHPLASIEGLIPNSELAKHVQLVLTDRSSLSAGKELGVMSPSTWRIADLFAKHAFLLSGLGWGGMPLHTVRHDLETGRLVELPMEDVPRGGLMLPMTAVYPTSKPPGPAGRWFIEHLKRTCTAGA